MKAIDLILCISFLLSPWILIGLGVIIIMIVYTRREKKMYEEQVAMQKAQAPSVIRDSNTVKVEYRMNLMDACIRKNFRNVKSWRVLGDEGAFHPMFWDNNWKYLHIVVINFFDGTSRKEKILIDPKTDTLTLQVKEAEKEKEDEVKKKAEDKEAVIKKAANEFLQRKDIIKILTEEKHAVVSENLPDQDVFELCCRFLSEEHGVHLYQSKNGWCFSFT